MIILCDPDDAVRSRLQALLGQERPNTQLTTVAAARAAVDQASEPTVLVFGPGVPSQDALDVARDVEAGLHPVAVVIVAAALDTASLREALRAGVSDALAIGELDAEELTAAVDRARSDAAERMPRSGSREEAPPGRVITVFSTKGGCGKSLVASNLAVLLQQTDAKVALVDLDLQSGDLAIMLQVLPSLSIYDASLAADRLDIESMPGYMTLHASGVDLLAAPMEPSLSEAVSPDAVGTMLGLLRQMYDYVVVDGPAFFTDQVLVAIDQTDALVLVASLDVPSVKSLRTATMTLHQLGYPREQVRTVLNRADSNVGLRVAEVEKSLGTDIDVLLPSSRDVPLSINQGAPLAADRRRSDVVRAIEKLVPKVAPEAATSSGTRSRFSRRR